MIEVVLDKLPKGVGEATIQAWYFEEGDAVAKGDEIAELSSEEGSYTIVAPVAGILAEVYYDEGETVEKGEVLCLIEDEQELESKDEDGDEDEKEEAEEDEEEE